MKYFFGILIGVIIATATQAQKITLGNVDPEEIKIQGFEMTKAGDVDISGKGAILCDDWERLIFYGWIIESDTREVVWHQFDHIREEEMRGVDGIFDFSSSVKLAQGGYELYFASIHSNHRRGTYDRNDWFIDGFNDMIDWFLYNITNSNYRRGTEKGLYIEVNSSVARLADAKQLQSNYAQKAEIAITKVGNSKRISEGFSLSGTTTIKLYAQGEGSHDEMYDYAWIMDANTRERVFQMNPVNSKHAGGARKNLKVEATIILPKGDYMLNYTSDRSHSYEKWNALPVNDISFYGVSIGATSAKDKRNFVPFSEPKTMRPIVSLTRAKDDEILAQGISIKKSMQINLYALGEEGAGDDMADYGWIVDASSREKVWKMKQYKTKHGGGAKKNRVIGQTITLEPGDYIVYYVTDDSHAYGDWNSSQPFEPEMWGITLWATKEADLSKVSFFHPDNYKNENELAVIAMVGDQELIKKNFTLQKQTKVRIVGIGEGTFGEMHDYGLIKNLDTGKIVWEMDYRNSTHGGGARKNREFNDTVVLKKGTYRVYFESDGSHSYNRWNDDPPINAENWGISVLIDKSK